MWGANVAVLDSGYGKSMNQHIFTLLPGQAFSCFYKESSPRPTFEIIREEKGYPLRQQDFQYHVTVNHTSLCDNSLSAIDSKQLRIPIDPDDELIQGVSPLRDMMDNIALARVLLKETNGKTTKRWIMTSAHYFAALSYALVGMDSLFDDESLINETESANFWTPRGYN